MASSAGTMPNTGRWGWYKDHEGREWRRVSTLIKKVDTLSDPDGKTPLGLWVRRQILLGAARRDDIVVGVKALGDVPAAGWSQQTKKMLSTWAEECMTAAGSDSGRTLGTAMHDLTERVDRGEPIEDVCRGLAGAQQHDLRAYAKLRELNGWQSVEIERTVVCDDLEVAGSFDRIDLIPGLSALLGNGTCQYGHGHTSLPVIVDVKTEGNPLLNGLHIGPQLAIYSRARRMWLPTGPTVTMNTQYGPTQITGQYVDAPCVRQDVAVIVHVRDGKAIPYFVDLTSGWEAAQAAARQLEREKAAKRWFAPVPGIVEPKPAEVLTDVAVAKQYGRPTSESGSLATAVLDASKMTATALGPAPMPGGRIGLETAELGPDGKVRYGTVMVPDPREQVAVTRPDGLVEFQPTPDVDKRTTAQALTEIWQATTLDQLAGVYEAWTKTLGLAWVGAVATAGERKRAQIECPQSTLHVRTGKCACGWTSEPPF